MASAASRLIALATELPVAERRRLLAALRATLSRSPKPRSPRRRAPRRRSAHAAEPYAALLALAGSIPGQPPDVSARVDDYLAQAALGQR